MFFYTFYNCKLQRSAAVQLIDFQKYSYVMVTKNYIIISPAKIKINNGFITSHYFTD